MAKAAQVSAFYLLVAALPLASGCAGEAGVGQAPPEALVLCLPGWWSTIPGACTIDPTCASPTGAGLNDACQATDCQAFTVTGYAADGTFTQSWTIASASARRLCTTDVASGTWEVVGSQLRVKLAALDETGDATCAGDVATVGDVERRRMSETDSSTLDVRLHDGSWDACAR